MAKDFQKKGVMSYLFHGVEVLIAIFLAVMVFFTFLNVVLRFVFNTGLAWSEEITRLCFIYLVYLGSIVAARDNAHLMVDTLIVKVPQKAKKVIYILIQIITICLMALLAWGSWEWALMKINDFWTVTHYPVFLINISGAVLGAVYIMICFANLLRMIVGKVDPMVLLAPRTENQGVDLETEGKKDDD